MREAEELFDRIGTGKKNAIHRPSNPNIDRCLRSMIEQANTEGDCIISGEAGYYRPRPFVDEERIEFKIYERSELSRARSILYKRRKMTEAFQNMLP